MPTSYPTSLDTLTNPSATDALTGHASQHANANDAIEALQAKLGTTSTPATLPAGTVIGKATGTGVKVDTSSPTWPWRDLIGDITPKTTGAGAPTLDTITGNLRGWRYSAADDGDIIFHLPHDYAEGTNLYLHVHWTHNGTAISGSFVVDVYMTYAKGHNQAAFHTQKTLSITDGSLTIGGAPQLAHRIIEAQMSTSGGSASQLDTSILEVDGLILIHYDVNTIPTISGGGTTEPFILTMDIHYQSTGIGTKGKAPSFYA